MNVVGLRCGWICCICSRGALTYQLHELGGGKDPDPPAGWKVYRNQAYCGDHEIFEVQRVHPPKAA